MFQGLSGVKGFKASCLSISFRRRLLFEIHVSSTAQGCATNKSNDDPSVVTVLIVWSIGPNDVLNFSTRSSRPSWKCFHCAGTSSKLGYFFISLIQAEHAETEANGSFRLVSSSLRSLADRSMSYINAIKMGLGNMSYRSCVFHELSKLCVSCAFEAYS